MALASQPFRPEYMDKRVSTASSAGARCATLSAQHRIHQEGACEQRHQGQHRDVFIDNLLRMETNPQVKYMVLLGEVGGTEEYKVEGGLSVAGWPALGDGGMQVHARRSGARRPRRCRTPWSPRCLARWNRKMRDLRHEVVVHPVVLEPHGAGTAKWRGSAPSTTPSPAACTATIADSRCRTRVEVVDPRRAAAWRLPVPDPHRPPRLTSPGPATVTNRALDRARANRSGRARPRHPTAGDCGDGRRPRAAYLDALDEPARTTLAAVLDTILGCGHAEPCVSYGAPAFQVQGKVIAGLTASAPPQLPAPQRRGARVARRRGRRLPLEGRPPVPARHPAPEGAGPGSSTPGSRARPPDRAACSDELVATTTTSGTWETSSATCACHSARLRRATRRCPRRALRLVLGWCGRCPQRPGVHELQTEPASAGMLELISGAGR